jgi:GntR family transcriptional regulator
LRKDSFDQGQQTPMLNPHSPLPLYHQLADLLLAGIRGGAYPPGARIPSEHNLAATYRIGRPTARQAVDLLVRKRILERRRGSGTYVRTAQQEVDLFSLGGTIASFHKQGLAVTTHILQPARLETVANDPLNAFFGHKAYFLSRLSRVRETPVLLEDIYLHAGLFAGIDAVDLTGRSLSQIVQERYYLRPSNGKQNFRIGFLDGEKALHLGVPPNSPILMVQRFLHFPPVENAIYAELFCRTDQFVFSQTIGGINDD